jgi:hypothetical protein
MTKPYFETMISNLDIWVRVRVRVREKYSLVLGE